MCEYPPPYHWRTLQRRMQMRFLQYGTTFSPFNKAQVFSHYLCYHCIITEKLSLNLYPVYILFAHKTPLAFFLSEMHRICIRGHTPVCGIFECARRYQLPAYFCIRAFILNDNACLSKTESNIRFDTDMKRILHTKYRPFTLKGALMSYSQIFLTCSRHLMLALLVRRDVFAINFCGEIM